MRSTISDIALDLGAFALDLEFELGWNQGRTPDLKEHRALHKPRLHGRHSIPDFQQRAKNPTRKQSTTISAASKRRWTGEVKMQAKGC